MAVLFEGFSIREYTREMRSADVDKCWPFADSISRECIESLLPPIAVAKFRWWSYEVGVLRAAEELDERRRGKKAKFRAPKKRSMVEIFAAAPPIRKKNDAVDGGDIVASRLINYKNMERKKKLAVTRVLKKKIKKRERKCKKFAKQGSIEKKVNEQKMRTEVGLGKRLDATKCSLGTAEDILNLASLSKKKASPYCLCAKKKENVAQSSKSIAKDEELILPVRSILKNKSKVYPVLNSSGCNSMNTNRLNHLRYQHDKHVRFSDQRHIVSKRRKQISPFEQSLHNLNSNAPALSPGEDLSSESSREPLAGYVDQHSGDLPTNAAKQSREQCMIAEEQLPDASDTVCVQNFLSRCSSYQERENNLPNKPVPPSEDGSRHEDYNAVHNSRHAVSPRAFNPSWKLIDSYVNHVHGFAAARSKGKAHVFPQITPSGSTLTEISNGRTPLLPQPAPENSYSRTLQGQTSGYQSPYEIMSSLCPLQERKKKAIVFRERHVDDEVLGLPLNSHGELVPGNATRSACFDQLGCSSFRKASSKSVPAESKLFSGAAGGFSPLRKHVTERALAKDSFDLITVHDFRNERPPTHLPARLGVDETFAEKANCPWENYDRGRDHNVRSLNSGVNLKSQSFNVYKQNHQIQNQNVKEMVESEENADSIFSSNTAFTMRLMGKDVAVGRTATEKQLSWGRKVWTNEGMIAENCPITSPPLPVNDSSQKGNIEQDWMLHSTFGNSKETSNQAFDNQGIEAMQCNTVNDHVPGVIISEPNRPTQELRSLTTNQNSSPTSLKVFPPPTSCQIRGRDVSLYGSVFSRADTSSINLQPPSPSTPWNTSPLTDYSANDFSFNPVIPHARKSSFDFPFMHPELGERGQDSWLYNSFQSSSPWLLHTTEQVKASGTPYLFPDAAGKQQPCSSGPNHLSALPARHSFVTDPLTTCSNLGNLFGRPSRNHIQHLPVLSGIRPKSSIIMSKRKKIKVKDSMKLIAFGSKDASSFKKTNKRQADGLEAVKDLAPKNLSGNSHVNAVELVVSSDKAIKDDVTQILAPVDDLRASHSAEFCRNGMQVGSIKLSAGAKHILMPKHNMDQDSSRQIHSSVPLVSATDFNSFAGPQMQSSKIYRL